MKKGILKTLVFLMMVFSLSSALMNNNKEASADGATSLSLTHACTITLKVGGSMSFSYNYMSPYGNGNTVTESSLYTTTDGVKYGLYYDYTTDAFVMNNFTYTCYDISDIFVIEDGVTLILKGNNTITHVGKSSSSITTSLSGSHAFSCQGDFTIGGTGSLSVNYPDSSALEYAILFNAPKGKLTIASDGPSISITCYRTQRAIDVLQLDYQGGTLNINAVYRGICVSENSNSSPYAIFSGGTINIHTTGWKSTGITVQGSSSNLATIYFEGTNIYVTSDSSGSSLTWGVFYMQYYKIVRHANENYGTNGYKGTVIFGSSSYDDTSIEQVKSNFCTDTYYNPGDDYKHYTFTKDGVACKTVVITSDIYHAYDYNNADITFEKIIHTSDELLDLCKNGGSGHLAADIDLTTASTAKMVIPSGKTVILCLNNHTITTGSDNEINGTLYLCDCQGNGSIKPVKTVDSSACFMVTGTLSLYSGNIISSARIPTIQLNNGAKFVSRPNEYKSLVPAITTDTTALVMKPGSKASIYGITMENNRSGSSDPIILLAARTDSSEPFTETLTISNEDTASSYLNTYVTIRNNYDGEAIVVNNGTLNISTPNELRRANISAKNNAVIKGYCSSDLCGVTLNIAAGSFTNSCTSSDLKKCADILLSDNVTLELSGNPLFNVSSSRAMVYFDADETKFNPISIEGKLSTDAISVYMPSSLRTASYEMVVNYHTSSSYNTAYTSQFKSITLSNEDARYMIYDEDKDVFYLKTLYFLTDPEYINKTASVNEASASYSWYKSDDDGNYSVIDGETSSKLAYCKPGTYKCKAVYNSAEVWSGEFINPTLTVKYMNTVDGTLISEVSYGYGEKITEPTDEPVVKDYIFTGWYSEPGVSFVFNNPITDYTVVNACFTAKDNSAPSLDNEYVTYNGSAISYVLNDIPSGIEASVYTVKYKVNNEWTLDAPANPGTYEVSITKEEDDTYKSLDETSTLYILKVVLSSSDLTLTEDAFTYNGSDQSESIKGQFTGIDNASHELALSITKDDAAAEFKNAGKYKATFSLSDTDKTYYTFDSSYGMYNLSDNCSYYEKEYNISKVKVTVSLNGSYTYDGSEQTADIKGDLDLVSTTDSLKETNAGTYTITYTINDSVNYEWTIEGENIITWVIDKAEAIINTDGVIAEAYYDPNAVVVNSGATLNHAETELEYSDNVCTEPGVYTIKITASETLNYYSKEVTTDVTILKALLNDPVITGEYTYTGIAQTVVIEGADDSLITAKDKAKFTQTNAGTYKLIYTINEPEHYEWAEGSTGTIKWIINKAQSVITVDDTLLTVSYGDSPVIPVATANFYNAANHEPTNDALNLDIYSLGLHTITYTVSESDNWYGSTKEVMVNVVKATYNLRGLDLCDKVYIYDGTPKSIYLEGNIPEGLTVTYTGNDQTEPGNYTVTVSFTSDEFHEDVEDKTATLSIRKGTLESKASDSKPYVVVECTSGFDAEVILDVDVHDTTADETQASIYKAKYSSYLDDNEDIGFIYDIKLYILDDEGNKTYLQPSDLESGSTLTIKFLIPSTVDRKSVKRILHIHNDDEVSSIEYNMDNIFDGYYEITVSKLSSFALVTEKETTTTNKTNYLYYAIGGAAAVIVLCTVISAVLIKKKKGKKSKKH